MDKDKEEEHHGNKHDDNDWYRVGDNDEGSERIIQLNIINKIHYN